MEINTDFLSNLPNWTRNCTGFWASKRLKHKNVHFNWYNFVMQMGDSHLLWRLSCGTSRGSCCHVRHQWNLEIFDVFVERLSILKPIKHSRDITKFEGGSWSGLVVYVWGKRVHVPGIRKIKRKFALLQILILSVCLLLSCGVVYELERNDCKHSTSSFTSYSTMVCSHHTSVVCGAVYVGWSGLWRRARSEKPIQTLPF